MNFKLLLKEAEGVRMCHSFMRLTIIFWLKACAVASSVIICPVVDLILPYWGGSGENWKELCWHRFPLWSSVSTCFMWEQSQHGSNSTGSLLFEQGKNHLLSANTTWAVGQFPDPKGEKMADTGDAPKPLNMGSRNFKKGLWFGRLSFGSSQVGSLKGPNFKGVSS